MDAILVRGNELLLLGAIAAGNKEHHFANGCNSSEE